jgi:hypothetical protein
MGQAMTTFFALFKEASSRSGPRNDCLESADCQFQALVEQGPFQLGRHDAAIPDRGTRLLIGVATWSGYDMRLLDIIVDSQRRNLQEDLIVEVFNVAECRKASDFRRYIPKLQHVFHTPVVGVWRNGQFQDTWQGRQAREFVALQFGSSSDEIAQYVQDWINARSPIPS